MACCFEIFDRAQHQAPSSDGIRRSRWLVVRNTLPQLETTTLRTWLDWFPEEVFGHITKRPPYRHLIKFNDIDLEVIFLPLDKPEDVKKVLSFDTTGVWLNEAREIHKDILDAVTGRVGRFPSPKEKPKSASKDNWPTYSGIIMDTNPPDDSHWWYKLAEEESPEGWEFFNQPSGLSKQAENIENLPTGYYKKMMPGKSKEWINVYVHGNYGFIQAGKPVYGTAWSDDMHAVEKLPVVPNVPIIIGLDFGLTPAAVFCQKMYNGQWRVFDEIVTDNMPLRQFSRLLASEIKQKYDNYDVSIWADPSGGYRDTTSGTTAFDVFKGAGVKVKASPALRFEPRREAVVNVLTRMVDGQPCLLVSHKCVMLRRGFNGGYHFKRLNVSGDERYADTVDKTNKFSHVHDALQYAVAGGGEYRLTVGRGSSSGRQTVLRDTKWSIL